MTLLLDQAFIPETSKPVTDQGLEETHTSSSQEETSVITETTGSNSVHYISHSTVKIICMY